MSRNGQKRRSDRLDEALRNYAIVTRDLASIEEDIIRERQRAWMGATSPSVSARKEEVELALTDLETERRRIRGEWEVARAGWKTELVKFAASSVVALDEAVEEVV